MNGPDRAGDGRAVAIDRFPEPVVAYAIDGGEPTVEAANEAFRSAFGVAASETAAASTPAELGLEAPDAGSLAEALDRTEPGTASVAIGDTAHAVRVVPPTDDAFGYAFFDGAPEDGPERDAANRPTAGGATDTTRAEGEDADEGFDVDRIASVLSHDLRNPLDVAKARLRAGRETGAEEHFDRVEKAHGRMERIIEDVLTLSRGDEIITPERAVELDTAANSAWETVETGTATLTIAEALPTTVADRDRVERLFENLFRNAVEHGEEADVTVGRLRADRDTRDDGGDEDGGENGDADADCGFYVADDGPGIPPDAESAVFDPGYSSHEHGTGLGLSIVRRIAECHGWTVEATNGTEGARFEFREIDPDA
ncbi:sensor histidine kinase [Natronomonas sp.]|uniref:sensor histidine kinase n=1 Tax=Natronomonas sp. TaxID=2184060 RepID=UPI00262A2652|nr:HAMP domain-containing sensor histidine kinase [Natronomonas sp.]